MVAITVVAIVLDTPRIVLALPATARAIRAMVVLPAIVLQLQPFPVHAIARAIVLPLQPFLQVRAIARMPQLVIRGQAVGPRPRFRPLQGIVRTRPRVIDPARMKPAAINVRRPPTLGARKLLVQMHFQDPRGGVRRAPEGTRVWQPRVAGEVARRTSIGTKNDSSSPKVLLGAIKGGR